MYAMVHTLAFFWSAQWYIPHRVRMIQELCQNQGLSILTAFANIPLSICHTHTPALHHPRKKSTPPEKNNGFTGKNEKKWEKSEQKFPPKSRQKAKIHRFYIIIGPIWHGVIRWIVFTVHTLEQIKSKSPCFGAFLNHSDPVWYALCVSPISWFFSCLRFAIKGA